MSNELAKVNKVEVPKNISDLVLNSIAEYVEGGQLVLPKNYSVENAMKSAYLILTETLDKNKQPVLEVCTKNSIANSLLEMSIMGLNPAKKQCYFIAYGKQLTLMTSYFGKQTVLKRIEGVGGINAQVIYKNDDFSYDIRSNGSIHNIEHKQSLLNVDDNNIMGAYCVIQYKGEEFAFLSTWAQIQEAQKGAKQQGSAKKNFRSEFAKRTIINKAVKHFLQTTDDTDLLSETLVTTDDQHFDFNDVNAKDQLEETVQSNANKTKMVIEDKDEVEVVKDEKVVEATGEVVDGESTTMDTQANNIFDFDGNE